MYVVERSCYSVPVALVQLRLLSIRYRLPPPRFRRILLASIASFHVLYSTITDSAINTIELVAVDIASEAVVQSKRPFTSNRRSSDSSNESCSLCILDDFRGEKTK